MSNNDVFGAWCRIYKERGFWPRPIIPGDKACHLTNWKTPDDHWSIAELDGWPHPFRRYGIALLMGSPFPDGTRLGAINVEHDGYTRVVAAVLGNPKVGKIGQKGVTYFVRVSGKAGGAFSKSPGFRVKGAEFESLGKVTDCLFDATLCVIPPTIHPKTLAPYFWVGPSLLEVAYTDLPIVEF
jgi:hypothetical protein